MSHKLILFPYGGNAKEALVAIQDINKENHTWDVIGFVDDDPTTHNQEYLGVKVLGSKDVISEHSDAFILAVIGNPNNHKQRQQIIEQLNLSDDRFATIIHPTAVIACDATVGINTLIMPRVVLSAQAKVGNHVVILPNSVISHDAKIGDYCCVGSNVSISGNVDIGSSCYIGSKTSVIDNVSIGANTLVGIGSNVLDNIDSDKTVAGNPAKEL